ncbi:MAG: WbqC family protein [Flammeovirgaceae bacterium]|nr:WbqC family protein [Flammeovirgaceae bacterium]MDW8287868.1 WbqC family protein [Flammeovirgaceae bacterium]
MNVLIELHYLPCLEYFIVLSKATHVWIEAHETFQKQTYRNRTYILTANKVERLTVPVLESTHHIPIQAVRIDYSQKWRQQHWRAIRSAYGKAPFFLYYADALEEELWKEHATLFDLNYSLLTLCHRLLGLSCQLETTTHYQKVAPDNLIDLRHKIHPKKQTGILHAVPYTQVFSNKVSCSFVNNLSIIDLLFCEGNYAIAWLRQQSSAHIP